jgi:hypothetical protein
MVVGLVLFEEVFPSTVCTFQANPERVLVAREGDSIRKRRGQSRCCEGQRPCLILLNWVGMLWEMWGEAVLVYCSLRRGPFCCVFCPQLEFYRRRWSSIILWGSRARALKSSYWPCLRPLKQATLSKCQLLALVLGRGVIEN